MELGQSIRNKNKQAMLKIKQSKVKALFNSLPNSNKMEDFGTLLERNYSAGSGLTGSLYQYKAKVKKCNHNTNIRKGWGYEGIVYKNN